MAQATRNSQRKKWEPTTVTGGWICVCSGIVTLCCIGAFAGFLFLALAGG